MVFRCLRTEDLLIYDFTFFFIIFIEVIYYFYRSLSRGFRRYSFRKDYCLWHDHSTASWSSGCPCQPGILEPIALKCSSDAMTSLVGCGWHYLRLTFIAIEVIASLVFLNLLDGSDWIFIKLGIQFTYFKSLFSLFNLSEIELYLVLTSDFQRIKVSH